MPDDWDDRKDVALSAGQAARLVNGRGGALDRHGISKCVDFLLSLPEARLFMVVVVATLREHNSLVKSLQSCFVSCWTQPTTLLGGGSQTYNGKRGSLRLEPWVMLLQHVISPFASSSRNSFILQLRQVVARQHAEERTFVQVIPELDRPFILGSYWYSRLPQCNRPATPFGSC